MFLSENDPAERRADRGCADRDARNRAEAVRDCLPALKRRVRMDCVIIHGAPIAYSGLCSTNTRANISRAAPDREARKAALCSGGAFGKSLARPCEKIIAIGRLLSRYPCEDADRNRMCRRWSPLRGPRDVSTSEASYRRAGAPFPSARVELRLHDHPSQKAEVAIAFLDEAKCPGAHGLSTEERAELQQIFDRAQKSSPEPATAR